MARLLALVTLVAGAFATMHESSFPISVPEVGGISGGGGQGVNVVSNSLQGGSSSVSVGVVIIASSNGGGSSVKNWNKPMMEAGMTHQVTVGGDAGLVYTPDTVNAAVGDMIQFNFMSMNHTVTQSSFAEPCVKMEGGVDSGFMPNPDNSIDPPPMMMFQVTTMEPVWMYCAQKGHCGKGMVFSINPTAEKSQMAFKEAAMSQNGTATASSAPPEMASASASASPEMASSSAAAVAAASSSAAASAPTVSSSSAAMAPAVASPASSGSIVQGSGTIGSGGTCSCSCLCGAGSFPEGAGVGMWGGMGGSMTITAAAKKRAVPRIF